MDDVILLQAENYYALGEFRNSYFQVQILNPDFTLDLVGDQWPLALALEIERIRSSTGP